MHSPLFRMRDCCCCIKDVFHAARQGVTSSRSRTLSCGWDCLEVCVGAHDLHKAYPDTKFT
jgi:hypothetical protein